MLRELQCLLLGLYEADVEEDVRDFVVTDREWLGPRAERQPQEELLIGESRGELGLALYVDPGVLGRIGSMAPAARLEPGNVAEFFLLVEGVSHFNYVAWNARRDKRVTLLELEMQAEVDKFLVACARLGAGSAAARMTVFEQLFADPPFDPRLTPVEQRRYRAANHLAGRYCRSVAARLGAGRHGLLRELRAFWRWPMAAKVSHIHATVFA